MTPATSSIGHGRTVIVGPVRYAELCGTGRRMLLDHGFTLVENESTVPWTQAELHELLQGADAAVAGVEVYDAEALQHADRLQIISRLGVGLDNIDLDATREREIRVVNVPGGNAAAVAELAIGFMIAVLRRMPEMDAATKAGRWDRFVGRELAGKAIGLIGFGAIAQLVARRLQGFDVEITAYDPFADESAAARLGVRLVATPAEAVADVDIVSVHAPHVPATHHIVDDALIAAMREGTILVNTARGGLVDQAALDRGLASGRIAGAGLDVFELEPTSADNPLFHHDNVVVAPHAAADSREAYERIGLATAQAIVDVFAGRVPAALVA
ncbi:phosphoglycerate dehydrogenase [Microbacterium sp.]|uniref:phosphoglycerate dehydrogenase n=1 Tax=Microbacterium sp. TaxID=51671 RepID=UPI0025ECB9C7|nr:phosphoglycerate dehydrogenase [Microbacterium sp.]MBT9607938.1 phosphoglycerate dehydrogenase [Microbacterium sp.]